MIRNQRLSDGRVVTWRDVPPFELPPNTIRGVAGVILNGTGALVGVYQATDGRCIVVYKARNEADRPVTEILPGFEIAQARAMEVMDKKPLLVLH